MSLHEKRLIADKQYVVDLIDIVVFFKDKLDHELISFAVLIESEIRTGKEFLGFVQIQVKPDAKLQDRLLQPTAPYFTAAS